VKAIPNYHEKKLPYPSSKKIVSRKYICKHTIRFVLIESWKSGVEDGFIRFRAKNTVVDSGMLGI
jgi:hypothetical protein